MTLQLVILEILLSDRPYVDEDVFLNRIIHLRQKCITAIMVDVHRSF